MSGVNLEVRVRPISGSRLVDDYLAGDPALAPFFPGHPTDPAAFRRKAEEIRHRFDEPGRRAATGAIRASGPEAARTLEAVADGTGFVVTTGQQPGLFGGPLYTVYKTLSTIALARRLEDVLEAPVLPLFWIASDDHDWAEANHVHVLDTANALRRLELEGAAEPPLSMGARPLGRGAETALDELFQILPPSEFRDPILERIRGAYRDGSVADAFARTMEGLFAGMHVAFVDAQAPAVRRAAEPVIRRELERAGEHERALAEQTARLEAAGYPAQVPVLPGSSNVFYEDEAGRERLVREDGGWLLRASRRRLADAELQGLLDGSPERFSGNVVLRPVIESAAFPTLAYVGGPGEVSYLAQTGCLFEAHGVGMPIVFPRHSVTLVEGKVGKVLEKFGLDVEDFSVPTEELVSRVVREEVPPAVASAVGRLRRSLQEGYAAVSEAAQAVDATLTGPITHAENEALKTLADVERKVRHHVKLQNETGLEQIDKAAANLAPQGRPQERVLNVHQYLARYGDGLLPAILERLDVSLDRERANWTGVRCG